MKVIFFLLPFLHVSLGIQPLISSPGNVSVLLFVDIHSSYLDNGTCTRIQWEKFELAYTLLGSVGRDSNLGIEVYDTCGSRLRTQRILSERLYANDCNVTSYPAVSGFVSITTEDAADMITSAARVSDILHVRIEPGRVAEKQLGPGIFYLPVASPQSVQFTLALLEHAGWDYITTVSDQDPTSMLEHDMFVTHAEASGVCVQYSHNTSDADFDFADVKTTGVVIFTSKVTDVEHIVTRLPATSSALVITHEAPDSSISWIKNGAIIADGLSFMRNSSEFLQNALTAWSSNPTVQLFFSSKYNCTLNTTGVQCPAPNRILSDLNTVMYSRRYQVLSSGFRFLQQATSQMKTINCPTFSVTRCLDVQAVMVESTMYMDPNGALSSGSPVLLSFSRIINGSNAKAEDFRITPFTIQPEIAFWFDETVALPSSRCSWCPGCKAQQQMASSEQMYFDGSYFYYPGDILIAGLFPLSTSWNRGDKNACSGQSAANNTDILTEAFLYALDTAHARYPGLLPNVKVGGLLIDTCSSAERASQVVLNFESRSYNFHRVGNAWSPTPSIVPAYLLIGPRTSNDVAMDISSLGKLSMSIDRTGNIFKQDSQIYDVKMINNDVIVSLLESLSWPYFGLMTSLSMDHKVSDGLYEAAKKMNVCLEYQVGISQTPLEITKAIEQIRKSQSTVVVVIATPSDIDLFYRTLMSNKISKTWILIETRENWLDILSHPLPIGTIIVQVTDKDNVAFNRHVQNILNNQSSAIVNPFFEKISEERSSCVDCTPIMSDMQLLFEASDVIKTVDIILHGLNATFTSLCPQAGVGLCEKFETGGATRLMADLDNVAFAYQAEVIRTEPEVAAQHNYVVTMIQQSGIVQVGQWKNRSLQLHRDRVKSYDTRGEPIDSLRPSVCFSKNCACVNMNTSGIENGSTNTGGLDSEMGYVDSTAKFDTNLWSIVVVVIGGSGSFFTLLLMIYIMCKVCHGSLIRRYLVLGILLLIGMVFLFMSVLPFVFTPSKYVCGMRYFAHGFSYAFCFAVILAKMTTLRDYKYIGLGGEISRLNQMLSVFFVTGVQLAIGVEWWVLRPQTVFETTIQEEKGGVLQEVTYYACDFSRTDFVAYHSYVIFLVLLCALYSVSVRKETKNMKEARLLLISSWFCFCLWIGIIVTVLVLDRQLLEAVCAIGVTANALTMLVIIYLPKITALSRLKYEVSQTKKSKENGYKIDPDFQFERPYSLPGTMGTMRSSITDKTLSTPRSLANFDTSMSY